jgi:hypothetical protein
LKRAGLEYQKSKSSGRKGTSTQSSSATRDLTLFGLATMMHSIHQQSNNEHAGERRIQKSEHAGTNDKFGHAQIGASDALANQAALLFCHGMSKGSDRLSLNLNSNDKSDPKKNYDIESKIIIITQ